jgi:alpha-2-macroglobulin
VGLGGERPPARKVEQEQIMLVPDKKEYAAGDTAGSWCRRRSTRPRACSPCAARHRRRSPLRHDRTDHHDRGPDRRQPHPNLHVQVDLVGSAPRTDDQGEPAKDLPPRPAFAAGTVELKVPPLRRTLALEVEPAAARSRPAVRPRST